MAHAATTYLQQLVCGRPALDVYAETYAQEALQLSAERLGLFQRRRAVRRDEVKRLQRLFIEVWGLVLDHLDGHDTQRPNVDFRTVLLLLNNFGCHPVRCADHRRALRLLVSELRAETEVGCGANQYEADDGMHE